MEEFELYVWNFVFIVGKYFCKIYKIFNLFISQQQHITQYMLAHTKSTQLNEYHIAVTYNKITYSKKTSKYKNVCTKKVCMCVWVDCWGGEQRFPTLAKMDHF
jgi:hypothetical protein